MPGARTSACEGAEGALPSVDPPTRNSMTRKMWPFEADVRQLVQMLARGDYAAVERRTAGVRLSASDMAAAVARYGRRLMVPPRATEPPLDVVARAHVGGWSVDVPLWSVEEGRSDLTLQLTILDGSDGTHRIEIDDLHVL